MSKQNSVWARVRAAVRRLPLWLIALPAGVSIWAGWVGLGTMCGFGVVNLLPGIGDGFELNTAITLPVGMEAYSAYALGTWLDTSTPGKARTYAKYSALVSLALGMLGQVAYHVLTAMGYTSAPLPVVVFVASLPVLVLGGAAGLHHLKGNTDTASDVATADEPTEDTVAPVLAAPIEVPAQTPEDVAELEPVGESAAVVRAPRRSTSRRGKRAPAPRRLRADYLAQARDALAGGHGVDPSPAWCRQVTGCSARLSTDLAKVLRAELSGQVRPGTNTLTSASAGAGTSGRTNITESEIRKAA